MPKDMDPSRDLPFEVTLLRQDNLDLVVDVVNAAFVGEFMHEIPKTDLLRVIRARLDRHAVTSEETGRFSRTAEYYLAYWCGSHSEAAWFGTRQAADGASLVTLLMPARRVVEFLASCATAGSAASRGGSAMDHLFDSLVQGAARLSGDVEARRRNLEAQIARLQLDLEGVDETRPPSQEERRDILDQIDAAFSDVRAAIAALAERMRDTNRRELDRISTGSVGQAIRDYRARLEAHRDSPAYRALLAMRKNLVDARRRAEVALAEHVLRETFSGAGRVEARSIPSNLFDHLAAVIGQIHEHELRAVEIQNSLIDSASVDTFRMLTRQVEGCLETFRRMRDAHEPGRQDPLLKAPAITLPRLPRLASTSSLRLATELPEERVHRGPAPRVLDLRDPEAQQAGLVAALAKEEHMKMREMQILSPASHGRRLSDLLVEIPILHGIEEVVRSLDICARRAPSRFDAAQMMILRLVDQGREIVSVDPILLESGAAGQALVETQACLRDIPGFPSDLSEHGVTAVKNIEILCPSGV
jgi:hypothetical protein